MYTMLGTQKARTHPVELAIGINIRNYFITSSPESPSNLASLPLHLSTNSHLPYQAQNFLKATFIFTFALRNIVAYFSSVNTSIPLSLILIVVGEILVILTALRNIARILSLLDAFNPGILFAVNQHLPFSSRHKTLHSNFYPASSLFWYIITH
ncbi:hypothetical protein F4815DRAFT_2620 [Daldinia loculata]|nr:hypothetical protein F4815DRAFT_2620 [Daldinia loculata]